jgi:hypothetical protein
MSSNDGAGVKPLVDAIPKVGIHVGPFFVHAFTDSFGNERVVLHLVVVLDNLVEGEDDGVRVVRVNRLAVLEVDFTDIGNGAEFLIRSIVRIREVAVTPERRTFGADGAVAARVGAEILNGIEGQDFHGVHLPFLSLNGNDEVVSLYVDIDDFTDGDIRSDVPVSRTVEDVQDSVVFGEDNEGA